MALISFEGLDGSGKSTQLGLLAQWLRERGQRVETFREPGGTALSERVREILLDRESHISPFAEMLLFSAARAQLVTERIGPLLREGVVVLCDRFFDSTTAYQGAGRQLADPDWLSAFHLKVTGGLVPHRTFLLELSPDEARGRRLARADEDRMEAAGEAFYERVGKAYSRLAASQPDRFVVLDATRSIPDLAGSIRRHVEELLESGHTEQPNAAPVSGAST